jgi:hypothetical protein
MTQCGPINGAVARATARRHMTRKQALPPALAMRAVSVAEITMATVRVATSSAETPNEAPKPETDTRRITRHHQSTRRNIFLSEQLHHDRRVGFVEICRTRQDGAARASTAIRCSSTVVDQDRDGEPCEKCGEPSQNAPSLSLLDRLVVGIAPATVAGTGRVRIVFR